MQRCAANIKMCVVEMTLAGCVDHSLKDQCSHRVVVAHSHDFSTQLADQLVARIELANEWIPVGGAMSLQQRFDDIVMAAEELRRKVQQAKVV